MTRAGQAPKLDLPASSGYLAMLVHEAHAPEAVNRSHDALALSPEAIDRMRGTRADDAPWNGYRVDSGVALIPILGALIPYGTFAGSIWGVTSYEGLRAELRRAAADPEVVSVALMIDSPGGYVTGLDATSAAIKALAAVKPVKAYVAGMCCSAAYWLACACDEIIAAPLAELGSIGVVQVHFDMSKMLQEAGIKVTVLRAGADKLGANPYEPLTERVQSEMTARLEDLRQAFAAAVSEGRKDLSVDDVLKTEAATFSAQEAVARGLADRVALFDEELPPSIPGFSSLQARHFKESAMTDKTFTQAEVDTAVASALATAHTDHQASQAAAVAAALAEGQKTGANAERARVKAIMDGPEAKGRERLAAHFAYGTDLPAEAVTVALAAAEKAAPPASAATLAQEMANDPTPAVGGDDGTRLGDLTGEAKGAAIAKSLGFGRQS